MIISDPFGSWVQGTREGLEDATKMRRAQDETAQANYGLQRAAQNDPYYSQILQNKAAESDIDRSLYPQVAQTHAEQSKAALDRLQQQIAESYGQYGLIEPLLQNALKNYPGATAGQNGLSFPVQGAQGTNTAVATPFNQINDPRRQQMQALMDYRNGQLNLGEGRLGVQQQRANQAGSRPISNTPSFLTGLGGTTMPAAPTLGNEVNSGYPFPYMPKPTNSTTPNQYGLQ